MSKHLNNLSYKDYEGSILRSESSGKFKVLNYTDNRNILIEFVDTGFRKVCGTREIKSGKIQDKTLPSVYSVGILGDKYLTVYKLPNNTYRAIKEYRVWAGMLERCYSEKSHRYNPTYNGCTVSDNFKYYPYFKEWCEKQVGFGCLDENENSWCLDKDILVKGNKTYSEDVCVFVPNEINCLFTKADRVRGKYPVGVYYRKDIKRFVSHIHQKSSNINLGHYDCPNEAFLVYKKAKEDYIKEIANKWKDQIDRRVYEAMINHEVEITD